jgi:hypothetical protein
MATFGSRDGSDALRQRVGASAHYSSYTGPRPHGDAPRRLGEGLGRALWLASLVLLFVVVALAVVVALGL